jgi:hypothetical protein
LWANVTTRAVLCASGIGLVYDLGDDLDQGLVLPRLNAKIFIETRAKIVLKVLGHPLVDGIDSHFWRCGPGSDL